MHNDIFSFKGHSGFKITLTPDGVVRKSSSTPTNSIRLQKQAEKQLHFKSDENFLKPKILFSGYQENLFFFDMEMMQFTDFVSFFETANKNKIDYVTDTFIGFIEKNIQFSRYQEISTKIITDKYMDIRHDLPSELNLAKLDILFTIHDNTWIVPIGTNHGDMTLSNTLFDSEHRKICLIDFLDSFIETPLNDIIKLRQDTKFKWSLQLYNYEYDMVKIETILNYMDKKIDNHFKQHFFYEKYYHIFEILNLLRVIRYATSNVIKEFLLNHINKLTDDLYNTSSR